MSHSVTNSTKTRLELELQASCSVCSYWYSKSLLFKSSLSLGASSRFQSVKKGVSEQTSYSVSLRSVHGVLGLSLHRGGVVLVEVHKLGEIKLGLLEELDLSYHAVVFKREDLGAFLLDLLANVV